MTVFKAIRRSVANLRTPGTKTNHVEKAWTAGKQELSDVSTSLTDHIDPCRRPLLRPQAPTRKCVSRWSFIARTATSCERSTNDMNESPRLVSFELFRLRSYVCLLVRLRRFELLIVTYSWPADLRIAVINFSSFSPFFVFSQGTSEESARHIADNA